MKLIVARWEQQEKGEKTPTMETVASRGRRRSEKLEEIVAKLNLESEDVTGKLTSSRNKNLIDKNIHFWEVCKTEKFNNINFGYRYFNFVK